jgi:hypothetical protein
MAPRTGHPSQNFGAKKERKERERQERAGRRESASLVPVLRAVTQAPTLPTRATRKAPEILFELFSFQIQIQIRREVSHEVEV